MIKMYYDFSVDLPSSSYPSKTATNKFKGATEIVNYEYEGRIYTKITQVYLSSVKSLTSTTDKYYVYMETDDGYKHTFTDISSTALSQVCVISDDGDYSFSGNGSTSSAEVVPVGGKYKITGSLRGLYPHVINPLRFSHNDNIYYAIYTGTLSVQPENNAGPFVLIGSFKANPFKLNDIIEIENGQYMLKALFNSLNLIQLFEYKYTIHSANNEVAANVNEVPPVRHIKFSYSLKEGILDVTGSNGVVNTLKWTVTAPSEGTKFLGLSFVKNAKRPSIPIGYDQDITIDGNLELYEVFGRDYTPTKTFEMNIYKNSAESNRVDKTNQLVFVDTLNGVLRESSNIVEPVFNISASDVPQFNYVYIPAFNRYYFVVELTSMNYNLWRLSLKCDVLMTYKDGIKALNAFVERNENQFNENIVDKLRPIEEGYDVQSTEIPNNLFGNLSIADKYIVVTGAGITIEGEE